MAGEKFVLEGRVSLTSFGLGLGAVLLPVLAAAGSHIDWVQHYLTGTHGKIAITVCIAAVNGALLLLHRGPLYKVAVRACFLGFAFGCGLLVSFGQTTWRHFGWYMCSLSFFHFSEYLVTAIINPHLSKSLSLSSRLPSDLKQLRWLSLAGLLMVLFGECLRKSAMLTAGSNFNHIVQNEKARTHVLVTSGVYSCFRHPSYVGWFYWSIGTQVMLCNPVCVLGYTLASWRFFRERIEEEEISLIHFFGEEYLEYKRKVPTGLPFIPGIRVES
ncbi:ICMT methyltransferase, partial [Amia calva]|nr:ICMT methyltransferase [Amia calva]